MSLHTVLPQVLGPLEYFSGRCEFQSGHAIGTCHVKKIQHFLNTMLIDFHPIKHEIFGGNE